MNERQRADGQPDLRYGKPSGMVIQGTRVDFYMAGERKLGIVEHQGPRPKTCLACLRGWIPGHKHIRHGEHWWEP